MEVFRLGSNHTEVAAPVTYPFSDGMSLVVARRGMFVTPSPTTPLSDGMKRPPGAPAFADSMYKSVVSVNGDIRMGYIRPAVFISNKKVSFFHCFLCVCVCIHIVYTW